MVEKQIQRWTAWLWIASAAHKLCDALCLSSFLYKTEMIIISRRVGGQLNGKIHLTFKMTHSKSSINVSPSLQSPSPPPSPGLLNRGNMRFTIAKVPLCFNTRFPLRGSSVKNGLGRRRQQLRNPQRSPQASRWEVQGQELGPRIQEIFWRRSL